MQDFQNFIESIDSDEINTIITKAQTIGRTHEEQAVSIALSLIERYHFWDKSDSSDETE